MKKKLSLIITSIFFILSVACHVNAATAVVVFHPNNAFMRDNFYAIAEALISPYFDKIYIGKNVDKVYANFSPKTEKFFDANFAYEYDCDYLIQISVSDMFTWKATHINAHTGHRTPLARMAFNVGLMTVEPDDVINRHINMAGYPAKNGRWINLELVDHNISDEIFCTNLAFVIEQQCKYWPRPKHKAINAQKYQNNSRLSPSSPGSTQKTKGTDEDLNKNSFRPLVDNSAK